jgi:hypothetical protein
MHMSDRDVSAAARQEAAAIYHCPIEHSPEELLGFGEVSLLTREEWRELAAALKPETFGLLGRLIERAVAPVVSRVEQAVPLGHLGLLVYSEDEEAREVRPEEVGTWRELAELWKKNLEVGTDRAIASYADPKELFVLRSLIGVRLPNSSLERVMSSGSGTAVGACALFQLTIDQYLQRHGVSDAAARTDTVIRSVGPILQATGLNTTQMKAFTRMYARSTAAGKDRVYDHQRNTRVNLSKPIEEFPAKGGGKIGYLPSLLPGERIGCPILLSPRLLQRLWVGYAGTARVVKLLGADPPDHSPRVAS